MKIADILRKLADIVDQADQQSAPTGELSPLSTVDELPRIVQIAGIRSADPQMPDPTVDRDDVSRRFQQIRDLMSSDLEDTTYANEPDEMYADIDAVTTLAGGGANGPKHPSDIRGEHPSMYPFLQHRG